MEVKAVSRCSAGVTRDVLNRVRLSVRSGQSEHSTRIRELRRVQLSNSLDVSREFRFGEHNSVNSICVHREGSADADLLV